MSWLNNVIATISPRWAANRQEWESYYNNLKNYDAAGVDRLNRWIASNQSAELTDSPNRDRLRARARDLERNSDVAQGILSAFERNVIGPGFALQAKTDDEKLNNEIEALWKDWTRARNCDVTGQQSLREMLKMAEARKRVDGGILFLKRYTKQGRIPFQLQVLEVDELDNLTMNPKTRGNKVRGGIEYNEYNKPVGYWIRQYDIDGYNVRAPIYIDAKDVIFYWTKKRPSQIREISDMAPTIGRVRDMNSYMEAVGVKERIAACFAAFIKKVNPKNWATNRGSVVQDPGDAGYSAKSITPGMIAELAPGDEIQAISPPNSGGSAADYIRLQQRMAGAGQGLSYETISRDMSQVNYSSARQGLIEDGLTYAMERENLIDKILDEIYETFIISIQLAGLVAMPAFWSKKEKYFQHVWVAPARRWIDPQKEANANAIALKTGQKTYQQICAENGMDWRQQLNDISEAVKYAKDHDIDLGGVLFGNPAYAKSQEFPNYKE